MNVFFHSRSAMRHDSIVSQVFLHIGSELDNVISQNLILSTGKTQKQEKLLPQRTAITYSAGR